LKGIIFSRIEKDRLLRLLPAKPQISEYRTAEQYISGRSPPWSARTWPRFLRAGPGPPARRGEPREHIATATRAAPSRGAESGVTPPHSKAAAPLMALGAAYRLMFKYMRSTIAGASG
jgi:hypothetical protein